MQIDLIKKQPSEKQTCAGSCRGMVFGGGITPTDLTAPGVTPDLTASPKIFTTSLPEL